MNKIKYIFENFNFHTLPASINQELKKLSSDGTLPIIADLEQFDCYILEKDLNWLERKIDKGLLVDENNIEITNKDYNLIFQNFGKGFNKGYSEFENTLPPTSSLFTANNDTIAFQIFNSIRKPFTTIGFPFTWEDVKKENTRKKLKSDSISNKGFEWGQQYKAWEIILNNIPLFEPIFEKHKPKEKELEIIDTSKDLPEIDLTTQKDKVRLIYDLGIIEYLQNKYPHLKTSNNQTSDLISKILGIENKSIQSTVNYLLANNSTQKNYPKQSNKVKAIIDHLDSIKPF